MGYVAASHSKVDSEIYIEIREKQIKAKVVKMPFLQQLIDNKKARNHN